MRVILEQLRLNCGQRHLRAQGASRRDRPRASAGLLVLLAPAAGAGKRVRAPHADRLLALIVWWAFLTGHILNNIRGFRVMSLARALPVFSVAFAVLYVIAMYFNIAMFSLLPAAGTNASGTTRPACARPGRPCIGMAGSPMRDARRRRHGRARRLACRRRCAARLVAAIAWARAARRRCCSFFSSFVAGSSIRTRRTQTCNAIFGCCVAGHGADSSAQRLGGRRRLRRMTTTTAPGCRPALSRRRQGQDGKTCADAKITVTDRQDEFEPGAALRHGRAISSSAASTKASIRTMSRSRAARTATASDRTTRSRRPPAPRRSRRLRPRG